MHEIETLVHQALNDVFTACSLTAYHHGQPLVRQGWGPNVRPDATRFDLASVSKLFTETALMALVSSGRVTMDTPLVALVPEFDGPPRPITGGKDPHTKADLPTPDALTGHLVRPADVTLRHLITHTSGLAPWMDVYNQAGAAPAPPTQIDPLPRVARWRKATRYLYRAPFVDHVGANVHYSDLGLMLVGLVVERLTGSLLDRAVRDLVTGPLELDGALGYNPVREGGLSLDLIVPTEDDPLWRGRRAHGEVHDENACGIGGVAGHAGLFGTSDAVAAFGEAWRTHDPRLALSPDLMRQAVRNQSGTLDKPFGFGWVLRSPEGSSSGELFSPASYGHTGFTGTSLWVDPERGLTVALLTNRVYVGRHKPGIHEFRRAVHDALARMVS